MVIFARVTKIVSGTPGHVVLQKELSIHQIFNLLDTCLDIILMLIYVTLKR